MFPALRTRTTETGKPFRLRTTAVGCTLACSVVFGAFPAATQPSHEVLERLLPARTVGVATIRSVDAIQDILDRWYASFQGKDARGESQRADVRDAIATFIAMDPRQIDATRPVAATLSLPSPAAPPMPSVIVPVRDEEAALSALEQRSSSQFSATYATGRGYLVMTSLPQYTPDAGTFELEASRNRVDARLALDVAAIYEMYGPMLEFFLASKMQEMQTQMADPAALEAIKRAAEWAQKVLGNAERFEMAISTEAVLRLTSTLRSRPGSPPVIPVYDSSRFTELSRVLDDDAALFAVASADLRAFYDWWRAAQQAEISRQLEAAPEYGDQIMTLLEYSAELRRLLAGPNAYSVDFVDQGVRAVQLMQLERPDAFVETVRGVVASLKPLEPLGLSLIEDDATRLEGVDVYAWRLSFKPDFIRVRPRDGVSPLRDFDEMHQRLFGADQAVVRLAIVDDIAVFVLHADETRMREALRRIQSQSGSPPQAIRRLTEKHGATPWLAAQTDLRALVAGCIDALLNPAAVADSGDWGRLLSGDPVPLSISSSQHNGVLRCELTADVHALANLIRSLRAVFPEDTWKPPLSDG